MEKILNRVNKHQPDDFSSGNVIDYIQDIINLDCEEATDDDCLEAIEEVLRAYNKNK